jgi:hypothetical protein
LEKLFHDDQPMGGGVAGTAFAWDEAAEKAWRDSELRRRKPASSAAVAVEESRNGFSIFKSLPR